MPTRVDAQWPRDLDRLRHRIEAWRRQPDRERRIPNALWAAAVKLARTHGVSVVSRAARLDYYSLKKRLEAGQTKSPRDGDRFIELPMAVMTEASPCVLELEDRGGRRLRVSVHGLDVEDVANSSGRCGTDVDDPGDGADARAGGRRAGRLPARY